MEGIRKDKTNIGDFGSNGADLWPQILCSVSSFTQPEIICRGGGKRYLVHRLGDSSLRGRCFFSYVLSCRYIYIYICICCGTPKTVSGNPYVRTALATLARGSGSRDSFSVFVTRECSCHTLIVTTIVPTRAAKPCCGGSVCLCFRLRWAAALGRNWGSQQLWVSPGRLGAMFWCVPSFLLG